MGWLDTIGGYPRDDSDEIVKREAAGIEQCEYLIKSVGGTVPEDITAIDCKTECPAFKVCQISDEIMEQETVMSSFDYEIPHRCQYLILVGREYRNCDKPAAYYGWWNDYDEGWWLCEKHWKICVEVDDGEVEECET